MGPSGPGDRPTIAGVSDARTPFPAGGLGAAELLADVSARRTGDADWRGGRVFSLVYNTDHEELEHLLEEVGRQFLHENYLNPFAFPSLLQMEADVVGWAAQLLHGAPAYGKLSSGGTESLFLAVQTARDWARTVRGIAEPQIVTPVTAHPALAKACHYLDVEQVRVPVGATLRVDPAAMEAAITDRTVLLVGSAPNYPFGTIDPIADLAALAAGRGLLCHVDACLGGWLLPFWERLGEPVPPWDLRVPGVTSISLDVHKYGYAFKGASVILYRDKDLLSQQYFIYDDWPGGLYGSATTAGTRSAAPIAGAWAAVSFLGAAGYLELAAKVRDATRAFQQGIAAIDGLQVTGAPDMLPDMSVFQFEASRTEVDRPHVNIAAVGDVLEDRGWHVDRQQGGLHLMMFPYHVRVADRFLADLADAVAHAVAHPGASRGAQAIYGATGD